MNKRAPKLTPSDLAMLAAIRKVVGTGIMEELTDAVARRRRTMLTTRDGLLVETTLPSIPDWDLTITVYDGSFNNVFLDLHRNTAGEWRDVLMNAPYPQEDK